MIIKSKIFIFLKYKSYWILTGSNNYFEVNRSFEKKLSNPYSNCLDDIKKFSKNKTIIDYFLKNEMVYNQRDCVTLCHHMFYLKYNNCSCNSTFYNFRKDCILTWIDNRENKVKLCVSEFIENNEQIIDCTEYCPLECDTYSLNINTYSEDFKVSGMISNKSKHIYRLSNFSTYEEVKKQYIGIYVYYSELKYTIVTQQPKTETFNLLSNLGIIYSFILYN